MLEISVSFMSDGSQPIETGEKLFCPICHGRVTGNDKIKYFCKRCNLLFSRYSLLNEEELNSKADENISEEEQENPDHEPDESEEE